MSLMAQWLRLHTPTARAPSLIPDLRTSSYMPQLKNLHAAAKIKEFCVLQEDLVAALVVQW